MNGFSLKMIFATAEDTDIIIFSGTTAWIVDINKLIAFVNSKIYVFGSISKR